MYTLFYRKRGSMMKKIVPIVFISLVLVALVGLAVYYRGSKMRKTATTVTTTETVISTPTPMAIKQEIPLSITSPDNGSTVKTQTVTIKGKTVPNGDVFVNDTKAAADSQGNFSSAITLDEGENTIILTANDVDGNSTEMELVLNYEPTE